MDATTHTPDLYADVVGDLRPHHSEHGHWHELAGVFTERESRECTVHGETASNYRRMTTKPGRYAVRWSGYWFTVAIDATQTESHYVNRLFHATSVHHDETICDATYGTQFDVFSAGQAVVDGRLRLDPKIWRVVFVGHYSNGNAMFKAERIDR